MSTNSAYTGELQPGDLVAVAASSSYLHIGFYVGRGPTGSFQFYPMHTLAYWFDGEHSRRTQGKKPYVSFRNSFYSNMALKISPETFTPEMKSIYARASEAMKLLQVAEDFKANTLKSK